MSPDFTGKSVFVAGGSGGINLGIARGFAQAGARVGVLGRNPDKLASAQAELRALGAEAQGYAADVRDYGAVADALAQFAQSGVVDVLISGAAGNFLAPAAELSANGFRTVVDIDLMGSFNVARAAYAHLRKPGAVVINISAPQSYVPMERQVHACAAKAGVDQLTRTLALEWGPEGVRVNSISPGPIAGTEGMARLSQEEQDSGGADRITASVPLRRWGTMDDIADAALFLASERAGFISGVVLPVDGGWGTVGPARSAIGM